MTTLTHTDTPTASTQHARGTMSREQVDALEGRGLDVAVAKAMGWTVTCANLGGCALYWLSSADGMHSELSTDSDTAWRGNDGDGVLGVPFAHLIMGVPLCRAYLYAANNITDTTPASTNDLAVDVDLTKGAEL